MSDSTRARRQRQDSTPEERLDRAEKRVESIEQKVAELAELLERQQSGTTRDEVQGIIGRLHEAVDAIEQAYATVPDVLRTRRLEVVDPEGTVRAVIGEHDSTFGLTISDEHGRKQVSSSTRTTTARGSTSPATATSGRPSVSARASTDEQASPSWTGREFARDLLGASRLMDRSS